MPEVIRVNPDLQVWHAMPKVIATLLKKNYGDLPDITVEQKGVKIPLERLLTYNKICGFVDSEFVPSTFLYVLSQPAQMTLLSQPSVPFALPGAVHFANSIRQLRPVGVNELPDFHVSFGRLIAHEKGQAFEMLITASINSETVWECTGVYLVKGKPGKGSVLNWHQPEVGEGYFKEKWLLDTGLGFRYGKVSGDMNPIHMHPLTAKLFGLDRHIIHGMYSKARILANLLPTLGADKYEVSVNFKVPIALPAEVYYRHQSSGKERVFDVVDKDMVKPHLRGYLKKLS